MTELFVTLLPFLLVDVLNPVLFAVMIVAAGSSRPALNSSAVLAGHTAAYFAAGVVIALGLEPIMERLNNPRPYDFTIEIILGSLCLWAAVKSRGGGASEEKQPSGEITPLSAFGFGAIVNFVGIPFALPYFAAVGQILKSDLSAGSSLGVLAVYNIAYALPFVAVPLMIAVMGDACRPILQKINNVLVSLADRLMPLLLLLLGLALLADSIHFFTRGAPLF